MDAPNISVGALATRASAHEFLFNSAVDTIFRQIASLFVASWRASRSIAHACLAIAARPMRRCCIAAAAVLRPRDAKRRGGDTDAPPVHPPHRRQVALWSTKPGSAATVAHALRRSVSVLRTPTNASDWPARLSPPRPRGLRTPCPGQTPAQLPRSSPLSPPSSAPSAQTTKTASSVSPNGVQQRDEQQHFVSKGPSA